MPCVTVSRVYCAVDTDGSLSKDKQPDSNARKRVTTTIYSNAASINSLPSENGASDVDRSSARKPEACGTGLAHEVPQQAVYGLDQFSIKSCSTISQPSTAVEKYE